MGNLCCVPRRSTKEGQKSLPRRRGVNSKTSLIDTVSTGSSRDGDRAKVTTEGKPDFSDQISPAITKTINLFHHSNTDPDQVALLKEELIGNSANEIKEASENTFEVKPDFSELTEETSSSLILFYQQDAQDEIEAINSKSEIVTSQEKAETNVKEAVSPQTELSDSNQIASQIKENMIQANTLEDIKPAANVIDTLSTMEQKQIRIVIEAPTVNNCTSIYEMEFKREPTYKYTISRFINTEITRPPSVRYEDAKINRKIKAISGLGTTVPSVSPKGANGEETEKEKTTGMVVKMEKYCVTFEYPDLRLGAYRIANLQNIMFGKDCISSNGRDGRLFKVMCDRLKKMLDQVIVYANFKRDKYKSLMTAEVMTCQTNKDVEHNVQMTCSGPCPNRAIVENQQNVSKPVLLMSMITDAHEHSEPAQSKDAHATEDIEIDTPMDSKGTMPGGGDTNKSTVTLVRTGDRYMRLETTVQKLNSYRVANLQSLVFGQMSTPTRGRNRKLFEIVCKRVKKRIRHMEGDANKRFAKWTSIAVSFSNPSISVSAKTAIKEEGTLVDDIGQDEHTADDNTDRVPLVQLMIGESENNFKPCSIGNENVDPTNRFEHGPLYGENSLGAFMSGPYEKVTKLYVAETGYSELLVVFIGKYRNKVNNEHRSNEFPIENKDLPKEIDRGPNMKEVAGHGAERTTIENECHSNEPKKKYSDVNEVGRGPHCQETIGHGLNNFEQSSYESDENERRLKEDVQPDDRVEKRVYGKTHRKKENFVTNLRDCVNRIREANNMPKLQIDTGHCEMSKHMEICKASKKSNEETDMVFSYEDKQSDIPGTQKQINENEKNEDDITSMTVLGGELIYDIDQIDLDADYRDPYDRLHDPVLVIDSSSEDEKELKDDLRLTKSNCANEHIALTVSNVNRVYGNERNENSNSAYDKTDGINSQCKGDVSDTNAENADSGSDCSSLATDPCDSDRHLSDFELSSPDSDSEEDEIVEYVERSFPHSAKFPNRKVELNFLVCFNIKPLPLQLRKCYKELDGDDNEVKQMTDEDARGSILEIRAERERRREETKKAYEGALLGRRRRLQELKERETSATSKKYVDAGT